MARRFFDPEGLVWRPLGFVGDLVVLSLLWGVCSIPLVTIGPATAALYDCAVRCVRQRGDGLFTRFFRTFRAELRTGIFSTLLWAALLGLPLGLVPRALDALPRSPLYAALAIGFVLLLFFLLAVFVWVFPTLSRFTFGFADLNRTALQLALGNILRSAAMALLTALGIAACWLFTSPLIFVPGLLALLWSYLIEPVFSRYAEPTETE